MYEYALIRTEVGAEPKHTQGMTNGRMELKTATNMLDNVCKSHFSVMAFGSYLYESANSLEDHEKMTLAFLYYMRELANKPGEDSISYMTMRIMDALEHYGYLEGA